MHLPRPTAWIIASVLAAATLVVPSPGWAAPLCPSAAQMPAAHAGTSSTTQLACDDPSGSGLGFDVSTEAGHGFALVDGSGVVSYFPDQPYVGGDAFTVTVTDNEGGSLDVQLSVEVTNAAPDCADDESATPDGDPVTVDLTVKCADPDGDEVTLAVVSAPAHGATVIGDDGVLTYTPDAGYSGEDSFAYQATDAWSEGIVGTATVSVGSAEPLDLVASVPRQTLRSAATNGLKIIISPSRTATCSISLSVSRKTARRLGIAPRATGPVLIGAQQVEATGRTAVHVPLTRRAARAFKKATKAVVLATVSAADGTSGAAAAFVRATLTNP